MKYLEHLDGSCYNPDEIINEKNMNDKKINTAWQFSDNTYIKDEKLRKKIFTAVKEITNKEEITADDISRFTIIGVGLEGKIMEATIKMRYEIVDEIAGKMINEMIDYLQEELKK